MHFGAQKHGQTDEGSVPTGWTRFVTAILLVSSASVLTAGSLTKAEAVATPALLPPPVPTSPSPPPSPPSPPVPIEGLYLQNDGQWRSFKEGDIPIDNNAIVIFDRGDCWLVGHALAGKTSPDLSKKSGGEYVWCTRIVDVLQKLGYNVIFVATPNSAEAVILAGREHGIGYLMFVHAGWHELVATWQDSEKNLVRPPFREECLVVMTFWGTSKPGQLWPGDIRFYITVYPHLDNMFAGLPDITEACTVKPAAASEHRLLKRPYGVVFGKFVNGGTGDPKRIHEAFHDASLWESLRERLDIVFVACSDALAEALGLGKDYEQRFICWNKMPERGTYHELLGHAVFMIGMGTPPLSPTPIEALQCRTPVIMPPEQHRVVAHHAWPTQFYRVAKTADVLAAVDACLKVCKPVYQPVVGREGWVEKVDHACFAQKSPVLWLLSLEVIKSEFKNMLQERHRQCKP